MSEWIQPYKYPVHRYCGESDCTSRKRLGRHRFKAEVQNRGCRLVAGFVWGRWFRAIRIGR
jgi:hypothetical protein